MWTTVTEILDNLGRIQTAVVIVAAVIVVVLWLSGIIPILLRLGNGLSRRRVAVFAAGDTLDSLTEMMRDSGLIRKRNIIRISRVVDIGRAEKATLYLVYWPDWKDQIARITDMKQHGTALIIYAPPQHGQIPPATMSDLGNRPNVLVTNFRGRLLNDIAGCLITTSYAKR
jgi:hypothetical protein